MLALVLIAAVVSGAVAAGVTLGINHSQSRTNPQTVDLGSRVTITEESAVVQVAAKALPSVVTVVTQNPGGTTPTYGSGFAVTTDGDVVTNADLVAHATSLTVLVRGDAKPHSARLLDYDCQTGVAVLKVESVANLPTLSFGSSAALKPGQTVIALAGPMDAQQTVTRGIVSGLGEAAQPSNPVTGSGTQTYGDTIQTDAAIGPGASGGPLLNVAGQVVGIDVAGTSKAGPVGFALAAADVEHDVQQILLPAGQLVVPVMGASGSELSPPQAALKGLPPGLLVSAIDAGSPAAQAGIKVGDVITQVEGVGVDQSDPLATVLRNHFSPDQRVVVTISRAGAAQQVPLTLGGGHPSCPA